MRRLNSSSLHEESVGSGTCIIIFYTSFQDQNDSKTIFFVVISPITVACKQAL